jgi:hypothetical protein
MTMMGPNIAATLAVALRRKQGYQNNNRQRHNKIAERRTREPESFDGRQHRNRRRDHGVAQKHRGADNAKDKDEGCAPAKRTGGERR